MNRTALKMASAVVLAASLTGAVGAPAFAAGWNHHHRPSTHVQGGNGGDADNFCPAIQLDLLGGLGLLGKGGSGNSLECEASAPGGHAVNADD
jgi:hypothetical protein